MLLTSRMLLSSGELNSRAAQPGVTQEASRSHPFFLETSLSAHARQLSVSVVEGLLL